MAPCFRCCRWTCHRQGRCRNDPLAIVSSKLCREYTFQSLLSSENRVRRPARSRTPDLAALGAPPVALLGWDRRRRDTGLDPQFGRFGGTGVTGVDVRVPGRGGSVRARRVDAEGRRVKRAITFRRSSCERRDRRRSSAPATAPQVGPRTCGSSFDRATGTTARLMCRADE